MKISSKTCRFFSFGCKVNQYETQVIRETFLDNNFKETRGRAECYVINSCTVTAQADKKCRQLIKKLHKKNKDALIILTGCYAQALPKDSFKNEKYLKVIPQKLKDLIPGIIAQDFDFKNRELFSGLKTSRGKKQIRDFAGHCRAFVKIQDGCRNFCSYCIVPHIRSEIISKDADTVIAEVTALAQKGFKEIVLAGINLGAWGKTQDKKQNLGFLVGQLLKLPVLQRLRLSSIELGCVTRSLMKHFLSFPNLCRHLHIPLQSADEFILKLMNRSYNFDEYLEKIQKLRKEVKDLAITTDIMVGFPQETEERFNRTLEAVKKIRFARVHIFTFSPRPGTIAAKLSGSVDDDTKYRRRLIMQNAAQEGAFLFRKNYLNKNLNVLFEYKDKNYWYGYSQNYILVKVKSSLDLRNMILPVKITAVTLNDTLGTI